MPAVKRRKATGFVVPFSQQSPITTKKVDHKQKDLSKNKNAVSPLYLGRLQTVTPNTRQKIKERFSRGILLQSPCKRVQDQSPGFCVPFDVSESQTAFDYQYVDTLAETSDGIEPIDDQDDEVVLPEDDKGSDETKCDKLVLREMAATSAKEHEYETVTKQAETTEECIDEERDAEGRNGTDDTGKLESSELDSSKLQIITGIAPENEHKLDKKNDIKENNTELNILEKRNQSNEETLDRTVESGKSRKARKGGSKDKKSEHVKSKNITIARIAPLKRKCRQTRRMTKRPFSLDVRNAVLKSICKMHREIMEFQKRRKELAAPRTENTVFEE